ncbi:hypothetical protein [Vibrio sp. 10N.261.51.F12]|uniref:hypothetical protein n=1 Tax=Vibrio sp. 10N.261.51.F12 TaxID=3229679 RepID=UPI00354BF5ED
MMKFIVMLALACLAFPSVSASYNRDSSFDIDNPTCEAMANQAVTNGRITLNFTFCNRIQLPDEKPVAWSPSYIAAYEKAGTRWLEVLTAVNEVEHHVIDIDVYVVPLADANGMAGPEHEIDVNWRLIPTKGSIFIGSHTYTDGVDATEFNANILHEMGHVFGVGAYTADYTRLDAQLGNVFKVRDSQAIKQYNRQYKVDYRVLPISDDGGHLYDTKWAEDKKRYDKNGRPVPVMTQELMANGNLIGPVTMGLMDDLGYQVNYANGDTY